MGVIRERKILCESGAAQVNPIAPENYASQSETESVGEPNENNIPIRRIGRKGRRTFGSGLNLTINKHTGKRKARRILNCNLYP